MLLLSVRQINYGRDFEQQLSFYVESRANFSNLDAVLVTLVQVFIYDLKIILLLISLDIFCSCAE